VSLLQSAYIRSTYTISWGNLTVARPRRNLSPVVVNIFSAIATGTFLYIGTTEILAEEFHTHHHKTLARWLKFGALVLGCAVLSVVRIWAGDDDHDQGGHAH
jgi:hypothetical protein